MAILTSGDACEAVKRGEMLMDQVEEFQANYRPISKLHVTVVCKKYIQLVVLI